MAELAEKQSRHPWPSFIANWSNQGTLSGLGWLATAALADVTGRSTPLGPPPVLSWPGGVRLGWPALADWAAVLAKLAIPCRHRSASA